MKKFFDLLFSMQVTVVLLLIFAFSAGLATFIENDFGTTAAQIAVYRATWFELLLLLLAVNLGGSLIVNRLWAHKKYVIFFFHFSFIIILLGSAITRYFGFEGSMHIRQGLDANYITSDDTYISAKFEEDGKTVSVRKHVLMAEYGKPRPSFSFETNNRKFHVKTVDFKYGKGNNADALTLEISSGSENQKVVVWGNRGGIGENTPVKINGQLLNLSYGSVIVPLPFRIKLNKFILERYPGSHSPSSYASEVTLIDESNNIKTDFRIYMNNILKYKGYRFYQSSYDKDEMGTILSVNHDGLGTAVSYLGYALMSFAMLFAMFTKRSRFRHTLNKINEIGSKKTSTLVSLVIPLLLFSASSAGAAETMELNGIKVNVVDKNHAANFASIISLSPNGRIEPMNTLSSKLLRKFTGKSSFEGLNSDQVFIGILSQPELWQKIPILKVSNTDLQKILNINNNYASFADFFDFNNHNRYKIGQLVDDAYKKKASEQTRLDKEVIKADEKVNVFYMTYSGGYLTFFPKSTDPAGKWFNPTDDLEGVPYQDSLFIKNIETIYAEALGEAYKTGSYSKADQIVNGIKAFQSKYAGNIIASNSKLKIEILYNKADIFERLYKFYGLIGFVFLVILFINLVQPKIKVAAINKVIITILSVAFLFQTLGLAARWYISGHAPMSNGYESMIFISWATMLAGFILVRKLNIVLAAATILASQTLMVAHLNWMNPEVTNLVPVLKSVWLTIHVAIITSSYGFFGLGAILGLINLLMMIFQNKQNHQSFNLNIRKISLAIEITLTIGLYMLTIGTFLGGVWANESWGRYWGWDPKETWALVTVLVYAVISHLNFIPGAVGRYLFNALAVLGFSSVLMTYFGVNYYLSGLHSYASGDPVPIPTFVYYTIGILFVILALAFYNNNKMEQLAEKTK